MSTTTTPELQTVSRFRDEVAWELVRDEWDLLLAIGAGPTAVEAAASYLGRSVQGTATAISTLVEHGLVRSSDAGFSLVPAFYERREGMASYLRDIVLNRLKGDTAPPLAGAFHGNFDSSERLVSFISQVETELLPAVLGLASRPESDASERFSVLFAVADEVTDKVREAPFRGQLIEVLRSAAAVRSLDPHRKSAYLWVAEMRTDPDVAAEVGEHMQRFFERPEYVGQAGGPIVGAAAFAVLSGPQRSRR